MVVVVIPERKMHEDLKVQCENSYDREATAYS